MAISKDFLLKEIDELNKLGHDFLNGQVNKMQFKGISGGFGVYAQQDQKSFMVRLRIASGVMNLDYAKKVYNLAKKYNLNQIHLTTRQAIQLHDLSIDEICSVMKEALNVDIHTRGAGGNYPRNVALSPLSGVDKEEVLDVTQYALAVNDYFMDRITTYKLPRKLKVSFSSSNRDTANCTIQDAGFLAVNKDGENYFKLYLGGGLGQNPQKAAAFDELVKPSEVLYHIEAIVNMFIAEGDYENKARARIRYVLARMGEEEFFKCYKKHLKEVKESKVLNLNIVDKNYDKTGIETDVVSERLIEQKQKGLYSVYVQPIGGQLLLDDLKILIDILEDVEDAEIRLSMNEGMVIRNLNGKEAEKVLNATESITGKTRLEKSVSCIGVPTCQMGIASSQTTLKNIIKYFRENKYDKDILPMINLSGCPNSCGVHQKGSIGLTGKKKRIDGELKTIYDVYIGGKIGEGITKLAVNYGSVSDEKIPNMLYKIYSELENSNKEFFDFVENDEEILKEILKEFLV